MPGSGDRSRRSGTRHPNTEMQGHKPARANISFRRTMTASAESSGISFVYPRIGAHGPNADGMDEIGPSHAGNAALSGLMRGSERIPGREPSRSDNISGPSRIGWTLPRVPAEAPVRHGT